MSLSPVSRLPFPLRGGGGCSRSRLGAGCAKVSGAGRLTLRVEDWRAEAARSARSFGGVGVAPADERPGDGESMFVGVRGVSTACDGGLVVRVVLMGDGRVGEEVVWIVAEGGDVESGDGVGADGVVQICG